MLIIATILAVFALVVRGRRGLATALRDRLGRGGRNDVVAAAPPAAAVVGESPVVGSDLGTELP